MAGEREIEIVIKGKNLTGDTFSEVSKGLTGISATAQKASGTMSTAFEKTSSAMSTAFGVLASTQLAQFSGAMAGFFKDLLGGAEEYAKQVEDLSRLTGSSVEDASRFIQIADDMRMSYADLSNALKLYSKTQKDAGNAADLSIETLARLSDAYLSLPEGIQRTNFLLDNFGRGGLEMGRMMEQGGAGIRSMAKAVDDSLVMTQDGIDKANAYHTALDDWEDGINGVKLVLAKELMPTLTNFTAWLTATAIPKMKEFVEWFGKLPQPVKDATVGFGGLLAVLTLLTPAMITLSFLLPGIVKLFTGLGSVAGAAGGLTKWIGGFGALVTILTKVTWVAALAYANFKLMSELFKPFAGYTLEIADAFGVKLPEGLKKLQEATAKKGLGAIFTKEYWAGWILTILDAIKSAEMLVTIFGVWISNFFRDFKWPQIKLPEIKWPEIKMPKIGTPAAGKGPGRGAAAGMGEIIPSGIIEAAKNKLLELQGIFNQVQGAAMGFISGISAAFANLPVIVTNAFTVAQTVVTNFFVNLQAMFVAQLTNILINAGNAFTNFGRTIEYAARRALAYLRTFVTSVQSWLSTLASRVMTIARDIGMSIVNGIWQGIQGGWEWLKTQIQANIDSLLAWVKTQLGITSPSKVFAAQVGLPIALGISEGITRGMDNVRGVLGSIPMPNISYAPTNSSFIPAPAYAGGRVMAGGSSYRVDVGRIEIHGSLSEGERAYFRKQSENITEKALLKVLK